MPSQLLTTDSTDFTSVGSSQGSQLVPRTLLAEVMNAARKKLMLRGLAARVFGPSSIPGRTLVLPLQTQASDLMFVDRVAEAGEFPLTQASFTNVTLTPVKYGARIGVSKELEEDALTDVASYHAELAGYEFADNEESLIVSQFDSASTAAGNNVANSNASLGVSDILAARKLLRDNNFMPTHIIMGTECESDVMSTDTFQEADKSGVNDPSKGIIGKMFGMTVLVSNNISAKLAYVIDAAHAFVIAEKRPLTIENYKDYSRDVNYVVASQRFATSYLRSQAVSEITTT
mgnify:CR=1 FL=1